MSAATSFDNRVQVTVQGEVVTGTNTMCILGLKLDRDCSFKSHVQCLKSKLRSKTWALRKLRKRGLDEDKLIHAYKTLIRPSVEYLAPVWSPMITAEQAELLERQQVQALKNIYGPGLSANKMRVKACVDRLSTRRKTLCLSFATKAVSNPRSSHWFKPREKPLYARREGVTCPIYREHAARTDRHKNSPKNNLIRLLNENQ